MPAACRTRVQCRLPQSSATVWCGSSCRHSGTEGRGSLAGGEVLALAVYALFSNSEDTRHADADQMPGHVRGRSKPSWGASSIARSTPHTAQCTRHHLKAHTYGSTCTSPQRPYAQPPDAALGLSTANPQPVHKPHPRARLTFSALIVLSTGVFLPHPALACSLAQGPQEVLRRDLAVGQYFVTGDLTREIFADDCRRVGNGEMRTVQLDQSHGFAIYAGALLRSLSLSAASLRTHRHDSARWPHGSRLRLLHHTSLLASLQVCGPHE